jgi:hypothetical protein
MVGDFGENQYLLRRISQEFNQAGCQVSADRLVFQSGYMGSILTATSTGRLLSAGAIIGATDPVITLEASYGILVGAPYRLSNPEHNGRKVYRGHGGYGIVANKWSEIVKAVRSSLHLSVSAKD